MNRIFNKVYADYFGLKVEVICLMKNSSLIRFNGREFVIDTLDLVFKPKSQFAA